MFIRIAGCSSLGWPEAQLPAFILRCAPYQTRVSSGSQAGRGITDSNTTTDNGNVGPEEQEINM